MEGRAQDNVGEKGEPCLHSSHPGVGRVAWLEGLVRGVALAKSSWITLGAAVNLEERQEGWFWWQLMQTGEGEESGEVELED